MSGSRAGEPSTAAFEGLFDAHYRELRSFAARRLGDRSQVEDVLSETFAVAWRRRDSIPERALPWLFAVCSRVIANQERSARRRTRLLGRLAGSSGPAGGDPAEIVPGRSAISQAFAELSPRQREILMLVAWDGLSAEDAGRVLGCSAPAFRVRLHRARSELAKRLRATGHEVGKSRARPKPDRLAEETR
jgi:RNA polymerase sigma-70 factor, ECF subfamily